MAIRRSIHESVFCDFLAAAMLELKQKVWEPEHLDKAVAAAFEYASRVALSYDKVFSQVFGAQPATVSKAPNRLAAEKDRIFALVQQAAQNDFYSKDPAALASWKAQLAAAVATPVAAQATPAANGQPQAQAS